MPASNRKAAEQARRYAFLLGQTDLFRKFIGEDLADSIEPIKKTAKNYKTTGSRRSQYRKTEAEEDEELILTQDNDDSADHPTIFHKSPAYVEGGEMRDYQIEALNWMISLYDNGVNGILADEMGLGKTLQTISLLGYLKVYRKIDGPHLVLVPKSTLHNWCSEFAKWVPQLRVFLLTGTKEERARQIKETLLHGSSKYDVCVTSYELCLREESQIKKIKWKYLIVDEAHRLKNSESQLSQILRVMSSENRMLITGTPLQNDLKELWALLNFLLPDVFSDPDQFIDWVQNGNEGSSKERIEQLHRILRPFLMRRVKSQVERSLLPKRKMNVYVGMTSMQKRWYQQILEKNIDAVNAAKSTKTRLLNIVMQLRKCCNHPYLFDGAEPGPPYDDSLIIENAGKMQVLDRMLAHLKENGHRVLLFSQMARMLDILEDYCTYRGYEYCRITGDTAHEDRIQAIDEFNAPDSSKFIFLLTTRAGGLGINLTTADSVILYDSDWNPQVDLQAEDRAHRIGQTKQVVVYRLVTENSIEEKILERATQKLKLDELVVKGALKNLPQSATRESSDEYLAMIRHGAEALFNPTNDASVLSKDLDVEELLRRSEEKTRELASKYENANLDSLLHLETSAYEWEGEDWRKRQQAVSWIGPDRFERTRRPADLGNRVPHPIYAPPKRPRVIVKVEPPPIQDWQFFDPKYVELYTRNYHATLAADPERFEQLDEEDKTKVQSAKPLSEDEQQEMAELANKQTFPDWSRKDFNAFLRGCEKYGRSNFQQIAQEVGDKSDLEIEAYSHVFFSRYHELHDGDKKLAEIVKAESKTKMQEEFETILQSKLAECNGNPLAELQIPYQHMRSKSKNFYSNEDDRFILVAVGKYGILAPDLNDRILADIRAHPKWRFNWFIHTRTAREIGTRVNALLTALYREMRPNDPVPWGAGLKKRRANMEDSTSNTALGEQQPADGQTDFKRAKMSPSSSSPSDEPTTAPMPEASRAKASLPSADRSRSLDSAQYKSLSRHSAPTTATTTTSSGPRHPPSRLSQSHAHMPGTHSVVIEVPMRRPSSGEARRPSPTATARAQ